MKWVLQTDSIFYNCYIMHLRVMQVWGMYPVNNFPMWVYYLQAGTLHLLFTTMVPVASFVYLFVNMSKMDLMEISDLLFMITELSITILKYLPIRLYPAKTKRTLEWLTRKEFTKWHPNQESIVKQNFEECRKLFIYFFINCTFLWFTWGIRPIIVGEKEFPNIVWMPFDPYENEKIYICIYTFMFIGAGNSAHGNASLDCLIAGLINNAAGQIKLIKGNLRDLIKNAEEKISAEQKNLPPEKYKEVKNQYIYQEICECVDRYNLVKQFVLDLEDTYSFSLFWQILASVFVICFGCIKFIFVELWTFNFFVTVLFVIVMAWQVLIYCYFGSLIYNESSSFVTDVYCSEWLDLDMRCQKALIIVIENAKRPLIIRAGKLIDLSLETFAMIMRRSYSLIAVLNNVYK